MSSLWELINSLKRSFYVRIINQWIDLHNAIAEAESLDSFNRKLEKKNIYLPGPILRRVLGRVYKEWGGLP